VRLNNYIIISLLTHLLFFSILVVLLSEMNAEVFIPVFDIDIVGPIIEERIAPQTQKIPVRPKLPVPRKSVPDRILSEPPPKTMFGEGTDSKTSPETMSKEGKEAKPAESGTGEADSLSLSLPEGAPTTDLSELSQTNKEMVLPKSFLFDKETIEKYAQKKTMKEKEKGLTFDAPELLHRGYMRMLKDRIESIWKYPEDAARRGISGDLYITFYIHKDGKLGEVKLVRTSGHRELDESAMKALRDAEPFWPLPEDFEKDALEIKGHFIYILGATYIM